jgi:predicted PurR-regulated permease PerM
VQSAISTRAWRRIIFGIIGLAVAFVAWRFAAHIPRTLSIFLIAAFIAFGVQPVCSRLEKRRVPKPLAIAIVFTALLLLIVVGMLVVVPLTVAQLQTLVSNVPSYVATLQDWLGGTEAWIQQRVPGFQIPTNAFNISSVGSAHLTELATGTLTSLGTILLGAATAFFIAFSSIVLSFFFLLNNTQIAEGFAALFPVSRRSTARKLADEITETFGSYISGQIIVSAITGIVVAVASALLGFKLSLILGILTFVGYSIPVIGMLIVQAIAVILCAPQGGWMILWVQVIVFGMARVSDNILVPRIMGQSVGVSPIGVMFAVFAGGELFGVPGLLLGIPAAALIKILWRYFVAPWLHKQLGDAK